MPILPKRWPAATNRPLRAADQQSKATIPIGQPGNGRPTPALWDAVLAAGGTAAAFQLLTRIDRRENWRNAVVAATPITGSSWDAAAGPDAPLAKHLAEWTDGSAVHPALAAANVETISGQTVLDALLGDRLEQLSSWAQQYSTGAVTRLIRPLEAVAAAGGWWCAGLDPTADWSPMAWGCFKPDAPRWDADRDRQRKYEHPLGTPARLMVVRVPAVVARKIAERHKLELPAAVAADHTGANGAFWRWWAVEPRLPLVITEGVKKAAAILSAGVPAVALPGIWNGAVKDALGRRTLHPDLAALPLKGRSCSVLFDYSTSERGRRDVDRAARRQGWLLQLAGANVVVGCCPGPAKGADDALAAGIPLQQLLANLQPVRPLPVLPALRRANAVVAASCRYLADAITIPHDKRVVALASGMGTGKTELIRKHLEPLMAAGQRVVLITHRRSLGAATAATLDLPWADEAAPGSDHRQRGVALCADSLCQGSGMRITPGEWRGAIVVIDEAAAVLAHALLGTATAVAKRRPAVLHTLQQLLANASQVLVADAQLCDPVLSAIEAAAGTPAWLIRSNYRPAAGRQLTVLDTREQWRGTLHHLLEQRRRLWIATTAKDGSNGAANIAMSVMTRWPDARILVVDSDTVADPDHDASRLAAKPNLIASCYDVVVASPAVAAGLSVTVRDHFHAVMVIAGGTTDANAVAQAAGRVRDDIPRFLFAPERTPGAALRIGNGSADPDQIIRSQGEHAALAGQLLAAGGWSVSNPISGPWLPLWAQLAAQQNAIRSSYRATVVALLEREGYEVIRPAADPAAAMAGKVMSLELKAIATEAQDCNDAAVIAADVLTDTEAAKLERKQHRTPAERAQLARYRIARRWNLADTAPTTDLLEADRIGTLEHLRFRWQLTTTEGRQTAARHDLQVAKELGQSGEHWQPDLVAQQHGPRLQVADALGLVDWISRDDTFTADDEQLAKLHDRVVRCNRATIQVLGISAATAGGRSTLAPKLRTTTLRRLLALVGYKLEASRTMVNGERCWRYRVAPDALPDGITWQQLTAGWAAQHSPYI
jgi:hypothetical protein